MAKKEDMPPVLAVSIEEKKASDYGESRKRMDEAIGRELIVCITGGAPASNAKPAELLGLLRELVKSCQAGGY